MLALCTLVSLQIRFCVYGVKLRPLDSSSMFLINPARALRSKSATLNLKPRTACAPDTIARTRSVLLTQAPRDEPELQSMATGTGAAEEREKQITRLRHAVVMLDLDKTAILGNDGNDLPLALCWEGKPREVITQLYQLLLSPNIKPALQQVRSQADQVSVVIYSRRPQVVTYTSPYRQPFKLSFNPAWHSEDGQLMIPGNVTSAATMMEQYRGVPLLGDERRDVEKMLERLIAARDAVAAELELRSAPTVVVTDQDKNVEGTAAALGLPTEHAVLFDDDPGLEHLPNVITVEPLTSLPPPQVYFDPTRLLPSRHMARAQPCVHTIHDNCVHHMPIPPKHH